MLYCEIAVAYRSHAGDGETISRVPRNQPYAEVAELADALASGASGRKPMKVRVLSSAPFDSPRSSPSASRQARSWRALYHVECPERVVRWPLASEARVEGPRSMQSVCTALADDRIVVRWPGSTFFNAATAHSLLPHLICSKESATLQSLIGAAIPCRKSRPRKERRRST